MTYPQRQAALLAFGRLTLATRDMDGKLADAVARARKAGVTLTEEALARVASAREALEAAAARLAEAEKALRESPHAQPPVAGYVLPCLPPCASNAGLPCNCTASP